MSEERIILNQNTSLVDVLDRVLDTGVVVEGNAMLSVADVDLVYLGLKLVLCSVDRLQTPPQASTPPPNPPAAPAPPEANASPAPHSPPAQGPTDMPQDLTSTSTSSGGRPTPPADGLALTNVESAPSDGLLPAPRQPVSENGLAQLVLALVELLRDLMERQAIHRMERGTLTDQQIEQLGDTFMRLEECLEELLTTFGLTREDLNLDLGPLGTLLER